MRFNFEWHDRPLFTLKDGMGLSHNAAFSGLTGIRNVKLVYYDTYFRKFTLTNLQLNTYGASATYPLHDKHYGYLNFDVFGLKNSVVQNAITMFGQYGHTILGITNPSITLSATGLSISAGIAAIITKTPQINKTAYTY